MNCPSCKDLRDVIVALKRERDALRVELAKHENQQWRLERQDG